MNRKLLVPTVNNLHEIIDNEQIVYITISGKYSCLKLKNGKKVLVRCSLKRFQQKLVPEMFCRVHKSYIVSLSCVISVDADGINMLDEKDPLPLGREFKEGFVKKFITF